jgi:flavorubredoxin
MTPTLLYDDGTHRNLLLPELSGGHMVQANIHCAVHGTGGILLDPGGHKVFNQVKEQLEEFLGEARLEALFFSHQDPDIVAAINGWLMTTDAPAWISELWVRFVSHFGLDSLVAERIRPIPDEGTWLDVGGCRFGVLPAHFLHSPGNFHLYDPVARILYTGDLGASMGAPGAEVTDFAAHVPLMERFHTRYMASGKALGAWLEMARDLDVEIVAPQHGSFFRGRETVGRLFDWLQDLPCGVDTIRPYRLPPGR